MLALKDLILDNIIFGRIWWTSKDWFWIIFNLEV